MLNMLPEVVSPGPLTMGFANGHTIHPIQEDDTIVISMAHSVPTPLPSHSTIATEPKAEIITMPQCKAALASIMAYLSDLDDLSENTEPTSPMPADLQEHQAKTVMRKASSAAISVVSSLPNGSSGEELPPMVIASSSKPKYKDDAVRREVRVRSFEMYLTADSTRQRVISEIISSERSYLAGLQELVTLYVHPASLPLRSSNKSEVRETFVPAAERSLVFSTAESIASFHSSVFLPELEKAAIFVASDRTSTTSLAGGELYQAARAVAQVFSAHAAFLK
jgi:hypothetical protein